MAWRRGRDPDTGELKAFGFVEFAQPVGLERALRHVHGRRVEGHSVVVRADAKTMAFLQRWHEAEVAAATLRAEAADEDAPPAGTGADGLLGPCR